MNSREVRIHLNILMTLVNGSKSCMHTIYSLINTYHGRKPCELLFFLKDTEENKVYFKHLLKFYG